MAGIFIDLIFLKSVWKIRIWLKLGSWELEEDVSAVDFPSCRISGLSGAA